MELGRVAGMGEPLATMARCNAKARAASHAAKSDRISRSVPADLLLLQDPARLDRIEVMRVRREVDDADAAGRADSDDPLVVMRREIVEQQDVTPLELGEQLLGEPIDEALLVRAGKHRGEDDQPVSRIAPSSVRFLPQFMGVRSMYSHPFFTQAWLRVIETLSPDSSRKTSRLDDTRRIMRQKAFRLATTFHDISSPIQRALDARHVAPLLAAPLAVVLAAISPAFPSGRRTRIASNSSRETLEGVPPPFLRGFTWPSRRNCHTQRFAVASPIQKRRARRMYPALSTLVRFDQPLPQFDRMGFCPA